MKKPIKIILIVVLSLLLVTGIISYLSPVLGISKMFIREKMVRNETQPNEPEASSIAAPSEVVEADCIPFGDTNNPELSSYYQKLNVAQYDLISACNTPKGKIVIHKHITGRSSISELYLDKSSELIKFGAIEARSLEVGIDSNKDVFFITTRSGDAGTEKNLYVYSTEENVLKSVVRNQSIKICREETADTGGECRTL